MIRIQNNHRQEDRNLHSQKLNDNKNILNKRVDRLTELPTKTAAFLMNNKEKVAVLAALLVLGYFAKNLGGNKDGILYDEPAGPKWIPPTYDFKIGPENIQPLQGPETEPLSYTVSRNLYHFWIKVVGARNTYDEPAGPTDMPLQGPKNMPLYGPKTFKESVLENVNDVKDFESLKSVLNDVLNFN